MRNLLVTLWLGVAVTACVDSNQTPPVADEDPVGGKGDGSDRVCNYDETISNRARELIRNWEPSAPLFPQPDGRIPRGPQPYYWRLRRVAEVTNNHWWIAVAGEYSWGLERNFRELVIELDANGRLLRTLSGRYIAMLTSDRFLLSSSRAMWTEVNSGHDPFYRNEDIVVVRPDGEIVQAEQIRGNIIDACGKFTRSGEDVIWSGRCDDNRDNVVMFSPYPRGGGNSCGISP